MHLISHHSQDWCSHLLHSSAYHRNPPGLCAQPPPVRSALLWLQPWQRENCTVKYADNITIICQIFNNDEGIYQEEITVLQSGDQNTTYYKMWANPILICELKIKETKTHTPVYNSEAQVEQVNCLSFLGF